nr:integrase, catalytic region, zinc finger, CCHC-type, peptidase aspartic, catalytic [Tanacetum cinerariifolium]
MWTVEEKKNQKIDHLARSLLIQGLPNDIYSLIESNNSAKELWDAFERHMLGSEYGKQDRKDAVLYEYETFKATEGEMFLDTYIQYLQSDGSASEDINDLKKITALLAKAFNRKKYYAKPTNNNLRTSSASSSANKKPKYVKSKEKKEDKKVDEKKRDMSKVKCYNCKKEGHFAKDCKKEKVKDYNYYKTKMLLAKKDSNKQVLLAEDQAWIESSSDSDQEINANMIFMAKIENVLSDLEKSSTSAEETIGEVSYYTFDSESEFEYETLEYYDNSTNYGLFADNDDDQEIFHDAIKSASENFNENHIVYQIDHDESDVDHNDSKEKNHLVDKLIKKINQKIPKCQNRETSSAYVCNDAMNVSCNSSMGDLLDDNNFFIFDDESVRISPVSKMPFRKNPRDSMNIVHICLWIIDSGCSKHMTGSCALLTNFVEKFLGTVRFGNNDFTVIVGYDDVVIGSMRIKKVYYVKGLGHNLFSVGQFCDKGLEVAFRKSTCFVRNEDGVDLLTV